MEMAVRAALLSEIQSVVSVARRRYGYSLTHTRKHQDGQASIFQSFSMLRARVLRCEHPLELNPGSVIRPFLDLIRHEHSSSTLTAVALEAVQNFLLSWDWDATRDPHAVADAMSDIVDAVSQCRFQETDSETDQKVLVMVVHVLNTIVTLPCASLLSDHSMWQLVEALYGISRTSRDDPHITLALRSTATNFLHHIIAFIFQSPSIYSDPATSPAVASATGFGLPCALKIVGFLCHKLSQRAPTGALVAANRREVFLSFSLLHRALLVCDPARLTAVPSLMLFVKDDLCGAILRYGRLGACLDLRTPVLCLEIVRMLWAKLRSTLKMQLEAIINGVFGHTLHWTVSQLDVENPTFPGGEQMAAQINGTALPKDDGSKVGMEAAIEEFTGEMVPRSKLFAISYEIIDCLVDLLAESTLLPDLYVNYDCDGNRSDITQNLFELLSQVVSQSHTSCNETHDEAHFRWSQAMGELALRGLFNSLYVVYQRTQLNHVSIGSAPIDDTRASSVPPQDSLLGELDGFETAEVLHQRRQRKISFQQGIQEFNRKPLAGIKYLQAHKFLPTPLDAKSLATLLRSLPQGLNKKAVGIYLGGMGKEVKEFEKTDIHESDTMQFHKDVLEKFVFSFNFEGESIVEALRMFLASFRLPGESQQIDRILNAFSAQVYQQCRDRFLMASEDVAYLLSFSLIMLNTDLHNPNIRVEKKMKLEDFIRNNKNYGAEVSRNQDLPVDYLTELYEAISKNEIKTCEDGGKNGEVTSDRWKDLLYQAENDPQNSRLIVHLPPSSTRSARSISQAKKLRRKMKRKKAKSVDAPAQLCRSPSGSIHSEMELDDEDVNDVDTVMAALRVSGEQYDRHIFELIEQNLLHAFASVFQRFVESSNRRDNVSSDSFGEVARVAAHYVPEKSMLQLACNGLVLCAATASHLNNLELFNEVFIQICKYTALFSSDVYPVGYNGRTNGVWLFCTNQSAPVATAAMLKLVSTCGESIKSNAWKFFFYVLAALREFNALPQSLLHPQGNDSLREFMTDEERVEFVQLVRESKEELERLQSLNSTELATTTGASGAFFSGVAWLFSAIDTGLGGSTASTTTPTNGSSSSLGQSDVVLSPEELAYQAEDLVLPAKSESTSKARDGAAATQSENFASDDWIRRTLQPYRLELFVQDMTTLSTDAVFEVVAALDDEINDALVRRPSEHQGSADDAEATTDDAEAAPEKKKKKKLTPGGCVLVEHLLSQILATCPKALADTRICERLHSHYMQLQASLKPTLVNNEVANGVTFEIASYLIQKAIAGLLAACSASTETCLVDTVVEFLSALVEMSPEEHFTRPFLSQIMCGMASLAQQSNGLVDIPWTPRAWNAFIAMVGWSIQVSNAKRHAFNVLQSLVASKIWKTREDPASAMQCYARLLMFATNEHALDKPALPRRPAELLERMLEDAVEDPDSLPKLPVYYIGGMLTVCRNSVTECHALTHVQDQHAQNELILANLNALGGMLHSPRLRDIIDAQVWFEIVEHGLLALAYDVLATTRPGQAAGAVKGGSKSDLFYFEDEMLANVKQPKRSLRPTPKKRRPSLIKDPLALRPHVAVVELLSMVICQQLDELQAQPRFTELWSEIASVLVRLLDSTSLEATGDHATEPSHGEVVQALERRTVQTAHEEILEHVKSIVRRLSAGEDASNEMSSLMRLLVEKCQASPGLLQQLFPTKDDAASSSSSDEVTAAPETSNEATVAAEPEAV
ncbi:TPA: hypothetical protein N0F65_006613 [Lagenidium giganteum]|uniref:SEC7 domain-containing protein n=1 Tax=Lagenidium giganteum TaxID=4803 RepID=A0AAV2ZC97_9STRA|nr:TPA: hypothetical protein N0F65_006613 [Lagenidium giganteum]